MQDPQTTTTPAPTRFQCRHILANGLRCRAVCLRHEEFCYFHHTSRVPIRDAQQRQERQDRKSRRAAFQLPSSGIPATAPPSRSPSPRPSAASPPTKSTPAAPDSCSTASRSPPSTSRAGVSSRSRNQPRTPLKRSSRIPPTARSHPAPNTPENPLQAPPTLEQILLREWEKEQAQTSPDPTQPTSPLPTLHAAAASLAHTRRHRTLTRRPSPPQLLPLQQPDQVSQHRQIRQQHPEAHPARPPRQLKQLHGRNEIVRKSVRYSAHARSSSSPTPSVSARAEYANENNPICRSRCAVTRSAFSSISCTSRPSGSRRSAPQSAAAPSPGSFGSGESHPARPQRKTSALASLKMPMRNRP